MRSRFLALAVGGMALVLAACSSEGDHIGEYEGDDPGECADDADNDRDGLFDCDDDGCHGSLSCGGHDCDPSKALDGWVCWSSADGGSGHYYKAVLVSEGIVWNVARDRADAAGGYLVTVTAASENEFVFSLIDLPEYWYRFENGWSFGPWLGGFQPEDALEPDGGWTWVNGEPWTYDSWHETQPNDTQEGSDYLHYAFPSYPDRASTWNDMLGDYPQNGYIIEAESIPSSD